MASVQKISIALLLSFITTLFSIYNLLNYGIQMKNGG
jgi:hypothetical protein